MSEECSASEFITKQCRQVKWGLVGLVGPIYVDIGVSKEKIEDTNRTNLGCGRQQGLTLSGLIHIQSGLSQEIGNLSKVLLFYSPME